jgi:hypothetical protein
LLVVALTIAGCGATAGQRAAGDRPAASSAATSSTAGDTGTVVPDVPSTRPSGSEPAGADQPSTAGGSGSSGRSGAAPFGTVDAVGGGQIRGAELAGRDVALWFWAPW